MAKTYSLQNIRLPTIDRVYYEHKLKEFTEIVCEDLTIKSVEFGRQDIRGGISITLIDYRDCVPKQKFFTNKSEMLGYVCGFIDGRSCLDFQKL